ncbi:Translation initiation factor IF-2 [Frankliniella fusca]|uniref:Translation initiation factor IF-2 n=1 Tax=Frankliniella fusca TaxID=407009 RepID=A0AAE1L9T7_9NEOP|nr:Translation initiation factor IF-2 [Frankliniella fusca]
MVCMPSSSPPLLVHAPAACSAQSHAAARALCRFVSSSSRRHTSMHYYVQLVVLASVVAEPFVNLLVLVDMVLKVSVGETWMRWLRGPPPGPQLQLPDLLFDLDLSSLDSEYTPLGYSDSSWDSTTPSSSSSSDADLVSRAHVLREWRELQDLRVRGRQLGLLLSPEPGPRGPRTTPRASTSSTRPDPGPSPGASREPRTTPRASTSSTRPSPGPGPPGRPGPSSP